MRTIPIVFAFDTNMEMPAGVCISSLLMNAEDETFYDIFILHSKDEDFSKSRINELPYYYPNCRITFRKVEEQFRNSYVIRGITKATYYKLLVSELVPEYDKILYSDVDVIFRDDLSKYWEQTLENYYYASVNSVPAMDKDILSYIKSLGIEPSSGYYYAGNLVINARLLREKGIASSFLKHQEKRYRFQDMDILNLVCSQRIKPLPPSFCLTTYYYQAILNERARLKTYFSDKDMDYALSHGIVHYNGAKPWKEICLNMDIWWDYYRRSIYFDESFTMAFWHNESYRLERMSLLKRIKLVGRYFRKGGRK